VLNVDTNAVTDADELGLLSPFSALALQDADAYIDYQHTIMSPQFNRKFDFGIPDAPLSPLPKTPDEKEPAAPEIKDPAVPAIKFLWKRNEFWQHTEENILLHVKKSVWNFYYNYDDHRVEFVYNELTGFRAVAMSGRILLEKKGDAKSWDCPCTATSKTTQKKFTINIGVDIQTDGKHSYYLKLDGQFFPDAQASYLASESGIRASAAFGDLFSEGGAAATLHAPKKLLVHDKNMIKLSEDSQTSLTGRWKTITTWCFYVHERKCTVRLEHGASGKKLIAVDGKDIFTSKGGQAASLHLCVVGGVRCEVHIRTRTNSSLEDKNTYVYELKLEGVDFLAMKSFHI
jgi:hypothetical protein